MAVKCKITGTQKRKPNLDGSCPECLTPEVKITGKGFVAAHDVKIDLGQGPQIPITDEGTRVGDPRDAAVRREVESRQDKAQHKPVQTSIPDPVETTGHGRAPVLVRGTDMAPVQKMRRNPGTREIEPASRGTMAGPLGRDQSARELMVGGQYGYLPQNRYDELTRTQQRKYWNKIGKLRRLAADRRRKSAPALAPVQAEVARLRAIVA